MVGFKANNINNIALWCCLIHLLIAAECIHTEILLWIHWIQLRRRWLANITPLYMHTHESCILLQILNVRKDMQAHTDMYTHT